MDVAKPTRISPFNLITDPGRKICPRRIIFTFANLSLSINCSVSKRGFRNADDKSRTSGSVARYSDRATEKTAAANRRVEGRRGWNLWRVERCFNKKKTTTGGNIKKSAAKWAACAQVYENPKYSRGGEREDKDRDEHENEDKKEDKSENEDNVDLALRCTTVILKCNAPRFQTIQPIKINRGQRFFDIPEKRNYEMVHRGQRAVPARALATERERARGSLISFAINSLRQQKRRLKTLVDYTDSRTRPALSVQAYLCLYNRSFSTIN